MTFSAPSLDPPAVTHSPSRSPADKRQQILEGAKLEFLAQGFAATSVDRIAAAAGVSKATIYSYFAGKEELFKALVEGIAQQRLQEIMPQLATDKPPRQVLCQIAETALYNFTHEPEFQAFQRLLIGESDRFPGLSRTFVECLMKPGLENLTRYLASQPQLQIADAEATARIFMGALVHFGISQEMMGGKEVLPLAGDRLITALIDLIAPES